MAMRPSSRMARKLRNPWPSSPSRFSAGTRHPAKASPWVSEACQPILRYGGATVSPGVPAGTTMALISGRVFVGYRQFEPLDAAQAKTGAGLNQAGPRANGQPVRSQATRANSSGTATAGSAADAGAPLVFAIRMSIWSVSVGMTTSTSSPFFCAVIASYV